MLIRIGATTRGRLLTTGVTAAALATAGGMARPAIGRLNRAGQTVFYRVRLLGLSAPASPGEPGPFRLAKAPGPESG